MDAMHPYIERNGLVRVIACAPVPRIATSRVSLQRPFYSSSSYCQTRTAQITTPTRHGNLNSNLDLTRNAIPCLYLNSQCFTQFVCCNCYERGADKIHCTFFSTRRAAALHIVRSATCRDAGKGVKTVTQEYRPSRWVEDQEAGPIGGAGTWPVHPAAPGMTYRTQYRPNL